MVEEVEEEENEEKEEEEKERDQGHVTALYNLGRMFEDGRGIAKDEAKAAWLYRLAVRLGHSTAQYNLGFMFENGRGDAGKNCEEAVKMNRLVANQRNTGVIEALKRLKERLCE